MIKIELLHQDTSARILESVQAPARSMTRLASFFKSNTSMCVHYYNPPWLHAMVAGQSDWHLLVWVSMTESPRCQKACPAPSSCSIAVFVLGRSFTSGVPGSFCGLCMWLESPSTPAHGQTTIQMEGKSHPNTTAECSSAFRGMTNVPNFSVHKSEGRKRSNKQDLWKSHGYILNNWTHSDLLCQWNENQNTFGLEF